ncbi:hypothetical protein [Moritella marina]|nr:hypothetical protein [Moritella marina]
MENKLGLGMLVALVFSTMVGAGIFVYRKMSLYLPLLVRSR